MFRRRLSGSTAHRNCLVLLHHGKALRYYLQSAQLGRGHVAALHATPPQSQCQTLFHEEARSRSSCTFYFISLFLHRKLFCSIFQIGYFYQFAELIFQVIPILRILYHAPENTSHHIYMSLIVLLILSEDETFNKKVHEIVSI